MLASALPFFFGKAPFALCRSRSLSLTSPAAVLAPAAFTHVLPLYAKLSFAARGAWLVDLGVYETQATCVSQPLNVFWQIYANLSSRFVVFNWGPTKAHLSSELFFRNAKWLEREAGEMHGVAFNGKKDRRTLFLLPVFFTTPLKKAFPLGGFFELLLCPLTAKLTFRHVSWLS